MVRDPSGAVVAGVKVTVTNVKTNWSRVVSSDPQGSYSVPAAPPGNYQIAAEGPGFQKIVLSGIVLQANQTARVDIELRVGQLSETVNVEASPPALPTEGPVVGGVLPERHISGLPLNGRNFMELTTLTGGINEGNSSTAKFRILNKRFAPAAAGAPATENNYQMDGADNREAFFNTYNVSPSVDAVQEFSIQVGQYSAEFGAGGGAVINVVTKSGTNEFHGAAWEFVRNDNFDARNFFLRPADRIAPLVRNQFGASLGGPLRRDRTFFFGNFEMTRERRGLLRSANVPTPAQRSGDLSAFGKALRDPLNQQPLPGGVIPASRINRISAGLAAYYPEPNAATPGRNYVLSPSGRDDLDSYLVRLDQRLGSRHDLFGRYTMQDVDRWSPGTYPRVGGQLQPQRFQGFTAGTTSVFSPTLLNEARFSFNRTVNRTKGQNTGNPIAAELGIPFAPRDPNNAGFVQSIALQNTAISGIGEGQPWYLTVNQYQGYDGVTWIRGAHTLKFGADIKRQAPTAELGTHQNHNYTFTGQFSGDGFADFLFGVPGSALMALKPNDPATFERWTLASYIQDDWRVTPTLTLNIGLRYEFNQIPREVKGLTPSFDPTLGEGNQLRGGLRFPKQNTEAIPWFRQNRPDLPVGLLDRETLFLPDRTNFAPRFGFAWRPFGKNRTVVRGGYGFYYSSAQLANIVQNSVTGPPAQLWPTLVSDPRTPTLDYGGTIGTPPAEALKRATFGVLTGPESQWLDAYTQQWSLSIGHILGRDLTVEAQYLGSKSIHLENLFDYNFTDPAPEALQPRLPFPHWGRVAGFSSGAAANYNALMLTAEKKYASGLTFKGAYTFAKALTKRGGRITAGNIARPQNPANLSIENGLTADDIRNRFTVNFLYDLPVGRGRRFGSTMSRALDLFLGGWTVAGIGSFHDGFPNATGGPAISGNNCNASFFNPCRPDVLRNPHLGSNGVDSPAYDAAAFDWPLNTARHPPQRQRYGNAAFNILRGNGINNWDLALHKHFVIREGMRLQLRWEAFNAFNHPSFASPNGDPQSPQFGRTFATQLDPRIQQFGLKLLW